MARTYIPKFLRMVQDRSLYLWSHQQHMVVAAGLTAEQPLALSRKGPAHRMARRKVAGTPPLPAHVASIAEAIALLRGQAPWHLVGVIDDPAAFTLVLQEQHAADVHRICYHRVGKHCTRQPS